MGGILTGELELIVMNTLFFFDSAKKHILAHGETIYLEKLFARTSKSGRVPYTGLRYGQYQVKF
jgi:hypothetical protein